MAKISEIVNESDKGDYIYRGEPKHYDNVSSGLYREYENDIRAEHFNIKIVQNEILNEARKYTMHKMDDLEILTELQHHGGKTNLIDFTTDLLIAFFFACNKEFNKPGRVILLQRHSKAYKVVNPPETITRAGIQKSIFIESPSGVVDPDIEVCIPADLKKDMLDYIQKHHNISTQTIYKDIQGFIENYGSHKSAYTEFYIGLTYQKRGNLEQNQKEKQKLYHEAFKHYENAIKENPNLTEAYNNRGIIYQDKDQFDRAIEDFNKAIDLNPNDPDPYINRGFGYENSNEYDKAIQDYNTVIGLNPDHTDAYYNRGNAYMKKNEYDRAIRDYDTAIRLNLEYTDAYINRGKTYMKKSEYDRAIRDYDTAIRLKPEYAIVYNNRGYAHLRKGQFDRAIQDCNKAINLSPTYATAYNNRGLTWLHKREWEKAKSDLITAKKMGRNIKSNFLSTFGSIETFETKHDVKIPSDITALLI